MKYDIKNIKYGDFVQTNILKYFFNSWILNNIFYIFMKLLIYATVKIKILHLISKKKIINYHNTKIY